MGVNAYLLSPAEVTEGALLRDLIFVFQNIDGQYIQFDSNQDAFRLSSKVSCTTLILYCVHWDDFNMPL